MLTLQKTAQARTERANALLSAFTAIKEPLIFIFRLPLKCCQGRW